ncbi:hypothetical protein [Aliikangiella coralliicola]|uniref:Uncharacterized protein n=1 Tax=Aliikangiella coralliicola TaxID=2592383 RepID=A0A545UFM2_9GAMM|nr:hypothetical protein [Aliikangiella coralliicola]TQV88267.1 hypothetical protein FLL46_06995 [Aliikangiella coralliicola]
MAMNDMNENLRRINAAIENYSGALMSNTKWKKVLDAAGKLEIPIQFAFVREEEFMSENIFPIGGYVEDRTMDCTIHGPIQFREIYAIKFPRYQIMMKSKTGEKYRDESRFNSFLDELNSIGNFELSTDDDSGILYAYSK